MNRQAISKYASVAKRVEFSKLPPKPDLVPLLRHSRQKPPEHQEYHPVLQAKTKASNLIAGSQGTDMLVNDLSQKSNSLQQPDQIPVIKQSEPISIQEQNFTPPEDDQPVMKVSLEGDQQPASAAFMTGVDEPLPSEPPNLKPERSQSPKK